MFPGRAVVLVVCDAQLAVLLTRSVSFNTTLSWAYDRAPNPTIYARYDITLRSAITVQF